MNKYGLSQKEMGDIKNSFWKYFNHETAGQKGPDLNKIMWTCIGYAYFRGLRGEKLNFEGLLDASKQKEKRISKKKPIRKGYPMRRRKPKEKT